MAYTLEMTTASPLELLEVALNRFSDTVVLRMDEKRITDNGYDIRSGSAARDDESYVKVLCAESRSCAPASLIIMKNVLPELFGDQEIVVTDRITAAIHFKSEMVIYNDKIIIPAWCV